MDTIDIFDIASLDGGGNGTWYKQNTTGDIPAPRELFCLVAASAPDNSSHNMCVSCCGLSATLTLTGGISYLYGGRNDTGMFDQVYVLSLPQFRWTKVQCLPSFYHVGDADAYT